MKKIIFFRRIGMLLLLLGALYTTITSISNMSFTDLQVWMEYNSEAKRNMTAVKPSENNNVASKEIEHPKTLEEAIDIERYPREKVIATGYTAGVESTGKTPEHPEYGITYSGVEVKRDLYSTIAADLDVFPIGTIMYIPDYGYGIVADKGSAITGNKIDLYYQTVDDVYAEWGKKEVEVYVIKLGEGHLTEAELVNLNENKALQVFREQIINE